ncbi:MAG: hypothetical protein KY456_13875 [Chloroflexi bacterium]|nr:hypothetical protein [Chloroflexota bacterium]
MKEELDGLARHALRISRRWMAGGALGAALVGASALLDEDLAGARKKGKKGKNKKKRKNRRGRDQSGGGGQGGSGCPDNARELPECLPGEEVQWCTPAPGNPTSCCPEHRIYAVCPLGAKTAGGECGASEEQAPSVCCPESRLCGKRCCEGPFYCVNADTSTCSGEPPVYARMRRPR